MKVATKLAVALLPCAVVVLALSGWLSIRREQALIEEDVLSELRTWGRVVAELVRQEWRERGPEEAQRLVERLGADVEDVRLRWVWVTPEAAPLPGVRSGPGAERGPWLAALQAGEPVIHVEPGEGDAPGRVLTYVPLETLDGRLGALELEESLDAQRWVVRDSIRQVVVSTLAMAVLLGALATVAGLRLVGRPMQRLLDVAQRVGEGDFSRRLVLRQRDEIGALADAMNAMCERLFEARERVEEEAQARVAAVERLRHADRLATLGRIAAGLAHEIGTPLGVAKGWAELIASGGLSAEEGREKARKVVELCRRMSGTIQRTVDFARRRAPHTSPNDLRRLVRRTLDLLGRLAERHGVELEVGAGAPVLAEVDGSQIEQVVTNLVVNAIYASPEGGRVEVDVRVDRRAPPQESRSVSTRPALPQDGVCIVVRDGGEGIPPEHLPHLWDPFFTTRPVGQGTGLGLPIARGIVEEHGGWIEVETSPGEGAVFVVFLPRSAAPASAPARAGVW